MIFKEEQLIKAKSAKSVEALMAFAKEAGVPISEAKAKRYFDQWHKEGELSDEELDNIAGGATAGCDATINGTNYQSYWITDDPPHYVIVSSNDSCNGGFFDKNSPFPFSIGDVGFCGDCVHFNTSGPEYYCEVRTYGNDPYYK